MPLRRDRRRGGWRLAVHPSAGWLAADGHQERGRDSARLCLHHGRRDAVSLLAGVDGRGQQPRHGSSTVGGGRRGATAPASWWGLGGGVCALTCLFRHRRRAGVARLGRVAATREGCGSRACGFPCILRHLRSVVVNRMLAESSCAVLRVRHRSRQPLSCLLGGAAVLGAVWSWFCAPLLFGSRGLGCVALHRAVRLIASAAGPCHGAGARRFIAAPHRGSRICMTTGRDEVSRTMLSRDDLPSALCVLVPSTLDVRISP